MSLTEITNGVLAATIGTTTDIFNVTATPGIYIAKLDVGAYARWNPVVVRVADSLPDGTATASIVYSNSHPKGTDKLVYTPPFPTASYFNLAVFTPTASANIPWSVLSLGTPTRVAHGSATLSSTAQQLGPAFGGGVYVVKVDLGPLQNGDEVQLHMWDTPYSGATAVISWYARYANTQRFPVKHSPPLPVQVAASGASLYAAQLTGTVRTIGYEILKLA